MENYENERQLLSHCLNHYSEFIDLIDDKQSTDEQDKVIQEFIRGEAYEILVKFIDLDDLLIKLRDCRSIEEAKLIIDDYDFTAAE